jgi:hypothetical protein
MAETPDNPEKVFCIQPSEIRPARIEFLAPMPQSPDEPIESILVRLFDEGLAAEARVDVWNSGMSGTLPEFLADLAVHWSGWTGAKTWRPIEFPLSIVCTHNGRSHVKFDVEMGVSFCPKVWTVNVIFEVELGQLDKILREAVAFFAGRTFA